MLLQRVRHDHQSPLNTGKEEPRRAVLLLPHMRELHHQLFFAVLVHHEQAEVYGQPVAVDIREAIRTPSIMDDCNAITLTLLR